jgi:O-antigen biosynthesis protein
VKRCAGHPALLCYAIGNEIPAPIVRWYGPRRVERFLRRLHDLAKAEDPGCLVTYVNYPTTEYLDLPFIDFISFNVYLETRERLSSYLKGVHNVAGQRPVLMAEIGLDSLRHGQAKQAQVLDWQIRTAFASGCCDAFVFACTDEWYRGGYDIKGLEVRPDDARAVPETGGPCDSQSVRRGALRPRPAVAPDLGRGVQL